MKTENNNFYNRIYIFQKLFFVKVVFAVYVVEFTGNF
jgi:hypothetical protein